MANAATRHQLQAMAATQIATVLASINHRMPPFPCVAIAFSKVDGNVANDVIRFSDQVTFDHYRMMRVGAIRVVLTQADLAEIPTPVLLAVYNRTRADKPLDRFRDRQTAESRVFEVLNSLATPYEESSMAEATAPATKAEAESAERKAQREAAKAAKAAEKEASKAARLAKNAEGVIGTIKSMIDTDTGATHEEILNVLVVKFPERTREGMTSTVKIQSSRLQKTTGRKIESANIVGRGRVYKFADKGPIPGEVVVPEAPAPAAPAEPKAESTIESTPAPQLTLEGSSEVQPGTAAAVARSAKGKGKGK